MHKIVQGEILYDLFPQLYSLEVPESYPTTEDEAVIIYT